MNRRAFAGGAIAAATAAALVLATPTSASASDRTDSHHVRKPHVRVLNSDVIAPFQLAASRGHLYVSDGATSTVSMLRKGGLKTVATGPQPGEVAGVAFDTSGKAMAYTATDYTTGAATLTIKRQGKKDVVADLSAFEAAHNPDAQVVYGVENPSQCVKDAFEPLGGATMTGVVESHPYAVASLGNGAWVVADAAGNDLLKVDWRGNVSLLALMPRQPITVTADIASAMGLPDCVVGVTYNFEPVPTDVVVGSHGKLYVSLLPGGPEDASLGARGSVYQVNRWNGHSKRIATGFLGATNLTMDPRGTIYVSELFAGRISTVSRGRAKEYLALPGVLSVEWANGHLYASTMAPMDEEGNPAGNGSIVRIER
ncbi:MAG TPA: ScyD/ScyE family protein [Actinomycetales bacterium]|nr:ScyD/ScyE family protein [Actinomycetales bacterium]